MIDIATAATRHFYRQASMLHALRHPNLVPVVAVWQEGVYGFVQMPFYRGGDLASWMNARPADGGRNARESLRLAEDLLSALVFLHERGKVHCDVKPQNIFLTDASRAVLGDFDGVKDADPPLTPNTESVLSAAPRATTILHVTAHYLAPEVTAGGAMTTAGDVYAAGVVLSELLGEGVLSGDPQRACALDRLVGRMKGKDPSRRPTAAEVLQSPVFSRENAETSQCVACFEVLLRENGLSCSDSGRHFLCAGCLNRHIESNARVDLEYSDVRARFKADDCRVSCMHVGCPSGPFSPPEISRHLRPDVHALWEGVRREAAEERLRAAMESEFEQRLQKALMEDGAQRKVREIAEDILTLKCPSCRAAFVDYDGCAALTCSRCGRGFCGYCLQDCGQDAHDHVPHCQIAREVGRRLGIRLGMYPGSIENWEHFQRERQADKMTELLQRLGGEERQEVVRLLRPLLDERGIRLRNFAV
uniref:Protein kinase domain-containing protein n=1 Tax=Chromera velia CCMP2878 TaxID=1169474 RepID=A0A0G4F0X3_9ALVE|mmetsp:Transcript_36062/g.70969  ORF Transcript_36062/g.70969 Transcript_36062/m.70969 type:complete len:476 (+) Transcript_36062:3-1430(+)|eukprot:Cvel_14551.t1-p1 / transcript=Cvel_14551.t1 / gene=Cvel_14551 / organism=Chromera_velia_CCMP2878 / gene_product=Serine/threonine-protein kinase PrkC, putative / transcript_product=Serine/threonine-protein kinase PrkC, putative / location=Cvel_scaffold1040:17971-19395(-) / protein_length=475 / sequence_SO=supercontig / SO=protein_coding / is_pseudo=false